MGFSSINAILGGGGGRRKKKPSPSPSAPWAGLGGVSGGGGGKGGGGFGPPPSTFTGGGGGGRSAPTATPQRYSPTTSGPAAASYLASVLPSLSPRVRETVLSAGDSVTDQLRALAGIEDEDERFRPLPVRKPPSAEEGRALRGASRDAGNFSTSRSATPDFNPFGGGGSQGSREALSFRGKEVGSAGFQPTIADVRRFGPRQATRRAIPERVMEQRGAKQDIRSLIKRGVGQGGVPGIVPERYRDEVAKYGEKFLDKPAQGTGLSGPEYLAGLIQFESGFDEDAHNPSGAHGTGQFMPGTRATFKSEYGVDPWASGEEGIKGAAMHASGKFGHAPLYAGYNPGYSSEDPVLSVDLGRTLPAGPPPKKLRRAVGRARDAGLKQVDGAPLRQIARGRVTSFDGPGQGGGDRRPFRGIGGGGDPGKLITPKWDAADDGHTETVLAKGISKPVKEWSKRYDVLVGAAYDPGGDHVSPGHNVEGTATDLYPRENTEAGWDKLEKGLAVLGAKGFEVGYDGSVPGTLSWSNHGRGNHAHVEWVGQGSAPDALTQLAGTSAAKLKRIEASGGGSAGAVPSTSGGAPTTGAVSSAPSSSGPRVGAAMTPNAYRASLPSLRFPLSARAVRPGGPLGRSRQTSDEEMTEEEMEELGLLEMLGSERFRPRRRITA